MTGNNRLGFSLLELMITTGLLAILATTAFPLFYTYQLRTKTSEAVLALQRMVTGQHRYYDDNLRFIEAGPTNIPPSSLAIVVNFSADPRWTDLDFSIDSAIYYGYESVLISLTQVDCRAIGDLNGDGVTSLFQRTVTGVNNVVTLGPLLVFDEIE